MRDALHPANEPIPDPDENMINDERDLAEWLGVDEPQSIARALYKATRCGIGYYATDTYVTVSGYCEGVEAECPSYALLYPFPAEEFDRACQSADQDGCDLWNETHGCDDCADEDPMTGYRPVNPQCPSCNGDGIIL